MRFLKVGGVIVGALIITALGIDATDTLQGSRNTLLGQLASTGADGACPEGMRVHPAATTFSCVDVYEASTADGCAVTDPQNQTDTKTNLEDTACGAVSLLGVIPWRFITREEASLACARSGKRLPTSEEWHQLAIGTPDTNVCNVNTQSVLGTGERPACISAAGMYDTVGNAWEWTSDDVFDAQLNGRPLPGEGYVRQVDATGIATVTGTSSSALFGDDYFWSKPSGAYALMRGGYYSSRNDGGVYTAHAATLPTMAGAAIGFRCVK